VGKLRAFLSYSTKDRKLAGNIKQQLEYWGIDVFLAHEDIAPSRQWQDEIIDNLKECQVFMPLLTKHFRKSEWTDQESGMAMAHSRVIVPLSVEMDLHGFIKRYQALKLVVRALDDSCKKILLAMSADKRLKTSLQEAFVSSFLASKSFDEANNKSELLESLGPYDADQLNRIFGGSVDNSQISGAFTAEKKLKELFKRNLDVARPGVKDSFQKTFGLVKSADKGS